MAQRRVMLGTPSHDWRVDVRYAHSLTATHRLCMEKGILLREIFVSGDSIVQNACNDLLAIARQNNFDDLIIIGSDQDWEAEWIVRLLDYPVDCIGGPVRKKTDERETYNVKAWGGAHSFRRHPEHNIITAPDMAVGTGFMRLSRKAMDVLWDASEKYSVLGKGNQSAWVFDIRPVDGYLVGEDIHICHILRKHGIEIWLDPTMNCGHVGQKRWVGDFATWLARLQAETPAQ